MSECKTIAVCNQKGGVGKTTTAVDLGAGLIRAGMTQLLRSINMVRTHTNEHLKIGGIVMTLVDGRTNLAKEVINTIRTNYGMSIKIFDMTMFTRHMSLVSYLQQVQIALIMIRRLMESQLSKRSIDLWIVASPVKWMLLFIKDGEIVIR